MINAVSSMEFGALILNALFDAVAPDRSFYRDARDKLALIPK